MFHNNQHQKPLLTAEQIEIRIWGFVVVVVMLVFAGITASMLYSVIFVTQPIKSMAPIDQAFTKMLNDIVLLIVGGIGGIMAKKGVTEVAKAMAPPPTQTYQPSAAPATPQTVSSPYVPAQSPFAQPFGGLPQWVNPALDETWTPGPPPTTPPDYLDPSREEIALERAQARSET
jgi:hypothetical protein